MADDVSFDTSSVEVLNATAQARGGELTLQDAAALLRARMPKVKAVRDR